MVTVEEIMTRRVLTLDPEATIDDAAWGLTMKGVSGAPVRDAEGHLLGVLSKSDVVAKRDSLDGGSPHTVKEAMTPALIAVQATDSVMVAAQRMVDTGTHRAVVVDAAGHMVGIVTPMDVVKALVTGRLAPSI
jgi:CBS-domain-containing membrane protein